MAESIIYLDSSVALRTILDVPERKRLQSWMQTPGTTLVSSRLLRTEVIRVLRRDGRSLEEGAPLLERVGMLEITRETHAVAESIERTSRPSTLSTWRRRSWSACRSRSPLTTPRWRRLLNNWD